MSIEERYVLPEIYYSKESAEQYEKNSRMRKIQAEMAQRAVELLSANGVAAGKVLDIGCGTGFSTLILKENNYEATGMDISKPMLEIAEKKGLKVIQADFRKLPFKNSEFDGIISISTLQWVHGKSYEEVIDYYRETVSEMHRVLRANGTAVIQFYPKTMQEMDVFLKIAKKKFKTTLAIDYPDNPKKRKTFIILNKSFSLRKTCRN